MSFTEWINMPYAGRLVLMAIVCGWSISTTAAVMSDFGIERSFLQFNHCLRDH